MKRLLYPLSLVALVTALAACGMNNAYGPNRGPHTQNTAYQAGRSPANFNAMNNRGTMDMTNGTLGGAGINRFGTTGYNRELADRIARAADAVPGVEGATAIVYGNDAVVGINTRFRTGDATQRHVVEQQVYTAARSVAPTHNVRVTSDSRMLTRITNLNNAFRNNGGNRNTGFGNMNNTFTGGPTTVAGNLTNAGNDFAALIRDLGRTVTAPFR
jgi:hypothetical protein